jgi:hypothetical protein
MPTVFVNELNLSQVHQRVTDFFSFLLNDVKQFLGGA